jgi:hypothetical protein
MSLVLPSWAQDPVDRPVAVQVDLDPENAYAANRTLILFSTTMGAPTYLALQGPQLRPDLRLATSAKPFSCTPGMTTLWNMWTTVSLWICPAPLRARSDAVMDRRADGGWELRGVVGTSE